ncbi:hypothetical protein, partial [Sulfuricurvum sp.]|uniref:hypothetical protein n=1 Tax=Sulfuricurvum sp. TaxID=2025608 RepID=UPI003BB687ED
MRQIGIFQWYSVEKGYGVISTIDSTINIQNKQDKSIVIQKYNEVFIHINNWIDKSIINIVNNPSPLVFDVSFELGKVTAKQCRYFDYSNEDFELLFILMVQYNGKLIFTPKNNYKSINLIDTILKYDPTYSECFDHILENKISQASNVDFINFIDMLYQYFNKDDTKINLIRRSALTRAQESSDDSFVFGLWEKGFLNDNDLTLETIKNNIQKINFILFKKLTSHPDVIDIFKALLEENNSELIYKLINYGLTIDALVAYTEMKVQSIVTKVESQNILAEASKLLNVANNQSIINEIINKELA